MGVGEAAGLRVLHDCPVKDQSSQGAECVPFRVQSLDLQLQGRVLQVEFAGRGDDLNAMDEVNDGITAQDLARGDVLCKDDAGQAGRLGQTGLHHRLLGALLLVRAQWLDAGHLWPG